MLAKYPGNVGPYLSVLKCDSIKGVIVRDVRPRATLSNAQVGEELHSSRMSRAVAPAGPTMPVVPHDRRVGDAQLLGEVGKHRGSKICAPVGKARPHSVERQLGDEAQAASLSRRIGDVCPVFRLNRPMLNELFSGPDQFLGAPFAPGTATACLLSPMSGQAQSARNHYVLA
jgi:hypothetical protein